MAMSEHVDQVFSLCVYVYVHVFIDVKHLLSNKKTNFISAFIVVIWYQALSAIKIYATPQEEVRISNICFVFIRHVKINVSHYHLDRSTSSIKDKQCLP